MFRAALIAAVLAVPAIATPADFAAWKAKFGKLYSSEEEESLRAAIFNQNVIRVEEHNAKNLSWTMDLNEFADLTAMEFAVGRIGGYVPRRLRRHQHKKMIVIAELGKENEAVGSGGSSGSNPSPGPVPSGSVDWTKKGAVTPVKNQGQCGSCWSFSTTGSIEGVNFINGHGLISLSEQQLVDCSGSFGNQGCNGGLFDSAFQYLIKNGGSCTEASYPYTGQDGTCKKCNAVVKIAGYHDVTPNSDSALATAVTQQPTSIAIEADQNSFQLYSGGVLTAACGTAIDHAVLAVGYGTLNNVAYWKVKNSWGASWGMSGYILLARGANYNGGEGQCGIYSGPSYPTQ
jgi:cathepsin L